MEHCDMRKLLTVVLTLAGLFGAMTAAAAQSTPDQAKALVEKATAYLKAEGKDKALAAFSDPKGEFVNGDLYLVVMDANDGKLTMLAHGVNKALIGKPQIDMKDADGKAFNKDTAEMLSKADTCWVEYKWPNPATKKIAAKRSFFAKVGDVVIGAGVYN
jgi:signal transduction histidine kinase